MVGFLAEWWGLLGIIGVAVGGIVSTVIGIRVEKRKTKNDKISKEFDLYTKLTSYMDAQLSDVRADFKTTFEANRKDAKNEKKLEVLSQQKLCSEQCGKIAGLSNRVSVIENTSGLVAQGVNILVKKALNEQLNGEVKTYKEGFDKYFIK